MKKVFAVMLAVMMMLAMLAPVWAAEVDSGLNGSATITIQNAAKGEEYKVYKLFDAIVGANNAIAYTGTIPDSLATYFQLDTNGVNIVATGAAVDSTDTTKFNATAVAALTAWAETATPVKTAEADGTALVFTNLTYGLYVVTTSQGTAITVTSTNPTATVYDKNHNEPNLTKTVNDADVDIGQTVIYTVTFPTYNFLGEGENAKQVVKYEIDDTLPEFLSDVKVTSLYIDNDGDNTTEANRVYVGTDSVTETAPGEDYEYRQFTDKKISIDWVDETGKSLYDNKAMVVITYSATVTQQAKIDGDGNTNTVTLKAYVVDGPDDDQSEPWEKTWTKTATIKTYAAALLKVDENNAALAGAKFKANGLTVTGANGDYTVLSYDNTSTTLGTEMVTDAEGKLIIKGLNSEASLTVYETEAPDGYNKIVTPITLTPTVISETVEVTSETTYYNPDGTVSDTATDKSETTITFNENLQSAAIKVENKKGALLPETGGVGTTMFYIVGGALVLGAVVVLVTRRRMGDAN